MAKHSELTGVASYNPIGWKQSADPNTADSAYVAPGKVWVDTSSGPPYQLKVRNSGDTAWETVGSVPASASETTAGVAEIATTAETNAGTDDARIVTPAKLAGRTATDTRQGVVELATDAETQTGTDTARAITPANLSARSATEIRSGVIEIATQGETDAGTDDTRAVTPAKLASYSGLGSTPDATETVKGKAEIATQAETNAGSDDTRIVTPAKLFGRQASESLSGIIQIATNDEMNTQTDDTKAVTPPKLSDFLFNQGIEAVPDASTTAKGKIEIATQGEVDTGTDTVRAVTPSTLANYSGLGGGGSADLEGLSDVDLTSPALRQSLYYDGTNFVNAYDPGHSQPPISKSANFTALAAEYSYLVDATSGAVTVTLPSASGLSGKVFKVRKVDSSANAVNIVPTGAETINGSSSLSLTRQYQTKAFESNGTLWLVSVAQKGTSTPDSDTLDDLTDVVISSPSTDEVLKFNGTNWVNSTSSSTDPRTNPVFFDDFISDTSSNTWHGLYNWTTGGTESALDSELDHPGIVRFFTSATTSSVAWAITSMQTGTARQFVPAQTFDVEFMIRLSHADSSISAAIGVSNLPSASPPAAGYYLEKRAADSTWQAVARKTATEDSSNRTRTDTGVTVTTGWTRLRVRRLSSTTVGYSVDGGTETVLTPSPTDPTSVQGPSVTIQTQANASKTIDIDYMRLSLTLNR